LPQIQIKRFFNLGVVGTVEDHVDFVSMVLSALISIAVLIIFYYNGAVIFWIYEIIPNEIRKINLI
jgi:hypothetical protein